MSFSYGKHQILSLEYNQDFVNSDLKLFWNIDFVARIAWFLGCELKKSSDNKVIKLNVQVWDRSKEINISYNDAHRFATSFLNSIRTRDPDFLEAFSIKDI